MRCLQNHAGTWRILEVDNNVSSPSFHWEQMRPRKVKRLAPNSRSWWNKWGEKLTSPVSEAGIGFVLSHCLVWICIYACHLNQSQFICENSFRYLDLEWCYRLIPDRFLPLTTLYMSVCFLIFLRFIVVYLNTLQLR